MVHLNIIRAYLYLKGESREIHHITPFELDPLFVVNVHHTMKWDNVALKRNETPARLS